MKYPNAALTPGAYTDTPQVRNVPASLKRAVYKAYGIGLLRRVLYVIDHLVPCELGGLSVITNLWPQRRREAKQKDRDENALAGMVRDGVMTLADAQQRILRDWGPR